MPIKDKEDELGYFSSSCELLHVFRHDQNLDCSYFFPKREMLTIKIVSWIYDCDMDAPLQAV